MLEQAIQFLQGLPAWGVLLFAFFITFLENIFPPAPCDSILVFCGALAGIGAVHVIPLTLVSTAGSTVGFVVMFVVGNVFGQKIVDSGKIKFIQSDLIFKAEQWFKRYGFWIIIGNRFLSGIRAVVSFFAGMSHLDLKKTTILSAISALAWNIILIAVGMALGENWRRVDIWMHEYGKLALPVIAAIVLIVTIVRYIYKKYFNQKNT